MKKIVLYLLTFVFILCAAGCGNADKAQKEKPFPDDIAAARSDVRKLFEQDYKDHPDFYAGNYMTKDKEWLVVQFTTDDTSEYDYLLEEHPCIKFNKVQYSLDELWEMDFDFEERDYYAQLPEIGFYATVSVEFNCLEVTVYPEDYTEENIGILEAALSDFPIRIVEQSGNFVLL